MAGVKVTLEWAGEGQRFLGTNALGAQTVLDGDGEQGPTPMQHLLLALAGCMGADLVDIMEKSRAPLETLMVTVVGERAEQPPRRYTKILMRLVAGGVAEADSGKLQRALDLSQQTYCSVLHTLRPDVELAFELERR